MSESSRILAERAIGQYPLSIATSLAIESMMGIHPEIKVEMPPVKTYGEFWVNVRTLYRNLMGAIEADKHAMVTGPYVGEELQREMDRIQAIIADGNLGCNVRFYLNNYRDIERKFPHARIREDATAKQKLFTQTMRLALKRLIELEMPRGATEGSRMIVVDLRLQPKVQLHTVILTHYPIDLCSAKHFGSLTLLESHTGAFKEKAQWHLKYFNGKELTKIPFREDLLQIFGDNIMFHPYPVEQRRELLEVASKFKWTILSTTELIKYSINQIQNPYFREKLRAMLV